MSDLTPMTRPSKQSIEQIKLDLIEDLTELKRMVGPCDALAGLETFCIMALRIMAKTNPSKIRDIARTVEIAYYLKQHDNQDNTRQGSGGGDREQVDTSGQAPTLEGVPVAADQ